MRRFAYQQEYRLGFSTTGALAFGQATQQLVDRRVLVQMQLLTRRRPRTERMADRRVLSSWGTKLGTMARCPRRSLPHDVVSGLRQR
jgi:hypothetical protein